VSNASDGHNSVQRCMCAVETVPGDSLLVGLPFIMFHQPQVSCQNCDLRAHIITDSSRTEIVLCLTYFRLCVTGFQSFTCKSRHKAVFQLLEHIMKFKSRFC